MSARDSASATIGAMSGRTLPERSPLTGTVSAMRPLTSRISASASDSETPKRCANSASPSAPATSRSSNARALSLW